MLRESVMEVVGRGPLPAEADATQEAVEVIENLLRKIPEPVTDEEAQELLGMFGPDGCFGLAWYVLHLIESAPNALNAKYEKNSQNEWVKLLEERRLDRSGPV
ncbi:MULTISPECIES: hypothetical protein [Parafrankia]|uniref:hypothetical protein n=1 Tax=Parafrankia TaxID=2994362 RepID=UPI000B129DEB|nr:MULTISPECIES: hypothetical protein [Parafrankia]MBE3205745.1 hypothetical protein [Parafrankia sp. CH37]